MHFDGEELKQLEKRYNIKIEEEQIAYLSDAGGILYKVGKEESNDLKKIQGRVTSKEIENIINCTNFPQTWKNKNQRNMNPKTKE